MSEGNVLTAFPDAFASNNPKGRVPRALPVGKEQEIPKRMILSRQGYDVNP